MEQLRGVGVDALVVALLVIVGLLVNLGWLISNRYRRWPSAQRPRWGSHYPRVILPTHVSEKPYDRSDAADQLRAVMAADFFAKPVMGRAEYRVFRAVEDELEEQPNGYRVFAQTALGEVIGSKDRNAHSAINSKRADFLVIRSNGLPVLAIEYQGNGHFRNDAAARDAVKREALRKAGVEYLEVLDRHTSNEVRLMVRKALARTLAPSTGLQPAQLAHRSTPH